MNDDSQSGMIHLLIAHTYHQQKNYSEMVKCYMKAIELDNTYAMVKIGDFYKETGKPDLMRKYYLMAVERGDGEAMYKLGQDYDQDGNITEMLKYYLMAAKKNNRLGMSALGVYYYTVDDYVNTIKYYTMCNVFGTKVHDINGLIKYRKEGIKSKLNDMFQKEKQLKKEIAELTNLCEHVKICPESNFNTAVTQFYLFVNKT